jgi:Sugar kinases, ribokinase family
VSKGVPGMAARMFDVVVVGNAGVDTNVYFHGETIDFTRESSFVETMDYVGEAGGYATRGFAQIGKRTSFIGYVGDDHAGRFVRDEFARDGIDATLFTDPSGTARSVNFMYRDGRRSTFYDGKGHMRMQPDLDLCRSVLARTRLVHFNIPNWARQLLPIAKDLGLTISCDIQDVVSPAGDYRWDFINYADILFFSAVNQPDPTAVIAASLTANPKLIVVAGMGAKGCALGTHVEGVRYFGPVPMDQPVIDTNGAGDSLAVGFLTSYVLDGHSVVDSVKRGQIAARYTCTLKASSLNLITREKLDEYFRSQQAAK